jgi:membrane carboxypeptidase/penicillin-binding protein
MASRQSITKKYQQNIIVSFVLAIGYIELCFLRFVRDWIASILCVVFGVSIAYCTFYCFIVLPSPIPLSQYQHNPSIAIYDNEGILLYKEWNTQRNTVLPRDIVNYRDVLPSKESMASYLTSHTTWLKTTKDKFWFQKKAQYLYPYSFVAATYMNAKIFQNGVVGFADAAEVYFQKDSKSVNETQAEMLLRSTNTIPKKNMYARMPTEVYAIRSYIEKKITGKKTGWLYIETSLDARTGTTVAYQSLINPNTDTIVMEGNAVRAWTKKNDQLLAARAILKTKEGGEYNE